MSIVMIVFGVALVALATFIEKIPGDRTNLGGLVNVLNYMTGAGTALLGICDMLTV